MNDEIVQLLRDIRDDQRDGMRRAGESLDHTKRVLQSVFWIFLGLVLFGVVAIGGFIGFLVYLKLSQLD